MVLPKSKKTKKHRKRPKIVKIVSFSAPGPELVEASLVQPMEQVLGLIQGYVQARSLQF